MAKKQAQAQEKQARNLYNQISNKVPASQTDPWRFVQAAYVLKDGEPIRLNGFIQNGRKQRSPYNVGQTVGRKGADPLIGAARNSTYLNRLKALTAMEKIHSAPIYAVTVLYFSDIDGYQLYEMSSSQYQHSLGYVEGQKYQNDFVGGKSNWNGFYKATTFLNLEGEEVEVLAEHWMLDAYNKAIGGSPDMVPHGARKLERGAYAFIFAFGGQEALNTEDLPEVVLDTAGAKLMEQAELIQRYDAGWQKKLYRKKAQSEFGIVNMTDGALQDAELVKKYMKHQEYTFGNKSCYRSIECIIEVHTDYVGNRARRFRAGIDGNSGPIQVIEEGRAALPDDHIFDLVTGSSTPVNAQVAAFARTIQQGCGNSLPCMIRVKEQNGTSVGEFIYAKVTWWNPAKGKRPILIDLSEKRESAFYSFDHLKENIMQGLVFAGELPYFRAIQNNLAFGNFHLLFFDEEHGDEALEQAFVDFGMAYAEVCKPATITHKRTEKLSTMNVYGNTLSETTNYYGAMIDAEFYDVGKPYFERNLANRFSYYSSKPHGIWGKNLVRILEGAGCQSNAVVNLRQNLLKLYKEGIEAVLKEATR